MLKRVLITGANSYVGTNVEKWLMREPEKYYVETLDMKDPNWKNFDFSSFDVVFHVAGIAHVSTKKSMKDLYFKVNRDLAIETAIRAKESGVKQFIFMSSMIVYSSKETRITLETRPNPDNFYGLSKLEAEKGIIKIESEKFKVAILRPPLIYGIGSKGNFNKLIRLAKITRFFPKFNNKRSFIHIDNISEIIKLIIDMNSSGIFFPQNDIYLDVYELVKSVRKILNKKTTFFSFSNYIIRFLSKRNNFMKKIFGDYYYSVEYNQMSLKYNVNNYYESLKELVLNE